MLPARELLTSKELAGALKRHVSFVYAMKARGFKMPGGLATVEQALRHLARHPCPRGKKPRK
jgi:hypothetical protein